MKLQVKASTTLPILVVTVLSLISVLLVTSGSASATACERPIKGEFVHKFVIDELDFQHFGGRGRKYGKFYYASGSRHGISDRKPSGADLRQRYVQLPERNKSWIFIPYAYTEDTYPTRRSSKGNVSLMSWLKDFKIGSSKSERTKIVERIYELYLDPGSASTATAKPCSRDRLTGQGFWKKIVVGKFRYKRGKKRLDSGRRVTVYRSRQRGLKELEEDQYLRIVRTGNPHRRDLLRFFTSYIGLSSSQAARELAELREAYYIPTV